MTDRSPYNLDVDLTIRGITAGETVAGLTACLDNLPPEIEGGSATSVSIRRSDAGVMKTEASRRYTVDLYGASMVTAQAALDGIRAKLASYATAAEGSA